jgi:hypothetical protein
VPHPTASNSPLLECRHTDCGGSYGTPQSWKPRKHGSPDSESPAQISFEPVKTQHPKPHISGPHRNHAGKRLALLDSNSEFVTGTSAAEIAARDGLG